MFVQLLGDVETAGVNYLVAGRLFGVRRQPVVLQGVGGQPGDVLYRQMDDSVFGHRRMAVADNPALVEIGGLLRADLLGDFVKRLRTAGGHRKGYGDLLLAQIARRKGVDAAAVGHRRKEGRSINCRLAGRPELPSDERI